MNTGQRQIRLRLTPALDREHAAGYPLHLRGPGISGSIADADTGQRTYQPPSTSTCPQYTPAGDSA